LPVGGSVTLTVPQTVGTDDIGTLVNVATVSGTSPTGQTVTAVDDASVAITQVDGVVLEPGISVVKTAIDGVLEDEEGNLYVNLREGESATITYSWTMRTTRPSSSSRSRTSSSSSPRRSRLPNRCQWSVLLSRCRGRVPAVQPRPADGRDGSSGAAVHPASPAQGAVTLP
jgi:hypothetical protein